MAHVVGDRPGFLHFEIAVDFINILTGPRQRPLALTIRLKSWSSRKDSRFYRKNKRISVCRKTGRLKARFNLLWPRAKAELLTASGAAVQ